MPYGIFAFALVNLLPGIVILAALGSNIYWVSVAVKLRSLLGQHVNSQLPSPNSQGNSVEITG
jgi:hypothetical protein